MFLFPWLRYIYAGLSEVENESFFHSSKNILRKGRLALKSMASSSGDDALKQELGHKTSGSVELNEANEGVYTTSWGKRKPKESGNYEFTR